MSKKDRMTKNALGRFWDIISRGGDAKHAVGRSIDFAKDVESTRNWILGALGFFAIVAVGFLLVAFLGLKVKQASCEHESFNHDTAKIEYGVGFATLSIECANCKKDFSYKVDREKEIIVEGTCILEGYYNIVYNFGVISGVDYTEKKMYSSGYEDHNIVLVSEQVDPTCGWPGKAKLEKCSVCNEVYGGEYLEPLGHDIIEYENVSPTCNSEGSKGGKHCSRCDYVREQPEILEPIEHTHEFKEEVEATYNNSGYKRYVCSMCNIDEYKTDIVEPLFSNYAYFGGSDESRIIFGAKPGVEVLDIPDTIDGIPVVEIDQAAFKQNETLKSVKLPSGLKIIDDYAFSNCINLESIELPETLSYIGRESFASCDKFTTITIPGTVKEINNKAFIDCNNLEEVKLSEGLQIIWGGVFSSCEKITSIVIPSTVTYIEYGAFSDCINLKTVYNLSKLNIEAGSNQHGYVALYATKVYNSLDEE